MPRSRPCAWSPALFPLLGYDAVRLGFGMPGLPAEARHPRAVRPCLLQGPGPVREAPARAMFEADAARGDIPAGQDGTTFGLEITQIDGTTLELFNDPLLAEEFGVPLPRRETAAAPRRAAARPAGGRPPSSAAISTGRTPWQTNWESCFGPGQLNLADRGFFSMNRFIRFSGAGAHPAVACQERREVRPFQDP